MATLGAVLAMVVVGFVGGTATADAFAAGSVPLGLFRLVGTILLCSAVAVTVIRADRNAQ